MALGGKHSLPGFEQSLEDLRADILMMAALVRPSLSNAKIGFVQGDEDACSAVIADDEEVDLLVKQVDKAGTNVLIRFQPLPRISAMCSRSLNWVHTWRISLIRLWTSPGASAH